eukprot:6466527-Amphidinium_carterae.1
MAATREPTLGDLAYLSVNINENLVLKVHRDLHNLSCSWLCSTGPYTGGQLWVEAVGDEISDECIPLPPEVATPNEAPGLVGHVLDPRDNWVRFDGRRWHAVLPASGRRLSVTLFSPRGFHKLGGVHWSTLVEPGFYVTPLLKVRMSSRSSPLSPGDESIMCELLQKLEVPRRVHNSTMSENNCIDELLGCLLAGLPCDFSDFLHELRRLCRGDLTRRSSSSLGSSSVMFPCGIPYMCEFAGSVTPPTSRRRAARWRCEHRVRMLVNYAVVYLQWLHLGQPAGGVLAERLAFQAPDSMVASLCALMNSMRAWCRSAGAIPADGGLSRTCSTLLQRVAREGHIGSYSGIDADLGMAASAEVPNVSSTVKLVAGEISLPSCSAVIPLVEPTVPKTIERLLKSERAFLRHPLPEKVAQSFLNVSCWKSVASELVSCGLGVLRPPEQGPQFQNKRLTAGLFGVPKKGTEKARLIVDRRPANSLEVSVREAILDLFKRGQMSKEEFLFLSDLMTLPYCGQFVRLIVPQSAEIRTFTEDAADYYYNLALPETLCLGNAVGPLISSDDLVGCSDQLQAARRRFGDHAYWSIHLAAPPMGDIKAPDIAQCVHAYVALRFGGLLPWNWLRYHHPCSGDALWAGCYVDDYGLIALLDSRARGCMAAASTSCRAQGTIKAMRHGYAVTGITRKVSKATENECGGTLWGACLDNDDHSVSTPANKRQLLVMATLWLCRAKFVDHRDVQVLLGHWVHHMMFLRPAMCTLDKVFSWLHHPDVKGKRRLVMPRCVRAELLGATILAPLLKCDVSKPLARSVVATDATLTRGAAVIAPLGPIDSIFVWLRSDRPLYPMQFVPGTIDEDMYVLSHKIVPDCVLQEWVSSVQFSMRAAYDFRTVRHVNCQELLAWATGLKAAMRDPTLRNTRLTFLLDSAVAVNILRKGRTSSRVLNGILKRSLFYLVLGGCVAHPLWIQSKENPADDPTRHAFLRKALELPDHIRKTILDHVKEHPWVWEAARLTWTDAGVLSAADEAELLNWDPQLPEVPPYVKKFVHFEYDQTLGYPGEGPMTRHADLRTRVLPVTEERYRVRLLDFERWLQVEGLPPLETMIDRRLWGALDCAATAFVQGLHDMGSPVSHGLWTLASLHYFHPSCQSKIPRAWLTQRQWQRREPAHYRCPMPPRVAIAIATVGWVLGNHRFSLAILLGYVGLLRPGEISALRRSHIVLPSDIAGFSEHLTICVAQSKTSTRSSRIQSVLITDTLVTQLAETLLCADSSSAPLLRGGHRAFVKAFEDARRHLLLEGSPFTLSTLRGGGAVWQIHHCQSIALLQWKGRWSSEKSVQHYLQIGLAATSLSQLSRDAKSKVLRLSELGYVVLNPFYNGCIPSTRTKENGGCKVFEPLPTSA